MMVLFSGTKNASSWAMRAWLALRAAGVDFEERVVDVRRPQRFANLAQVGAFSPAATVPVLLVDGVAVFDSLAIMEFANDRSGGRLMPGDPLARAEARSIVAWQHAGLSGICRRIHFESAFYPVKRALEPDEQAECGRLFAALERYLERSGGPFLFGDVSLADLSLTPAVLRLSRHQPDLASWPLVAEWSMALLDRPDTVDWTTEADSLPHVWLDEYLPSGTTTFEADPRLNGPA